MRIGVRTVPWLLAQADGVIRSFEPLPLTLDRAVGPQIAQPQAGHLRHALPGVEHEERDRPGHDPVGKDAASVGG